MWHNLICGGVPWRFLTVNAMTESGLAADTQASDQILITALFNTFEVIQKLPALCHQFQKATTRMVIFLVGFEVLSERCDARC